MTDQSGEVRRTIRRLLYQSRQEGFSQLGVLGLEKVGWMKEWGKKTPQNWVAVCQECRREGNHHAVVLIFSERITVPNHEFCFTKTETNM